MEQPVDDLLAVLGRERLVLGNLLFRLLEARGLLATGESRFLHLAARDIEAAAEAVREVELTRALLEPLAEGQTLRELVEGSPPPLDGILHDHHVAIARLAAEVGAAIEATADLAEHGLASVRGRALVGAGPGPRPIRPVAPLDDLDREILAAGFESVITASSRLMLPSLVAFLG
jgi:hypothetical protein